MDMCTISGKYGSMWLDPAITFEEMANGGYNALNCPQCGCGDSVTEARTTASTTAPTTASTTTTQKQQDGSYLCNPNHSTFEFNLWEMTVKLCGF